MAAGVVRRDEQAALPTGRNTCAAAQRDEQQRLHAAVSVQPRAVIIRNTARQREIFAHIRICTDLRAVVVKAACEQKRVLLIAGKLFAKRTDERREANVRVKLLGVERRLLCTDLCGFEVVVFHIGKIFVFDPEGFVFLEFAAE